MLNSRLALALSVAAVIIGLGLVITGHQRLYALARSGNDLGTLFTFGTLDREEMDVIRRFTYAMVAGGYGLLAAGAAVGTMQLASRRSGH